MSVRLYLARVNKFMFVQYTRMPRPSGPQVGVVYEHGESRYDLGRYLPDALIRRVYFLQKIAQVLLILCQNVPYYFQNFFMSVRSAVLARALYEYLGAIAHSTGPLIRNT